MTSPTTPEGLVGRGPAFPPPFQVTRHILSFLKWRFSSLPPGSYQWKPETEDSPDQSGSEVFIAADTPIRPEVVGQRPAITVMRSQVSFQGAGIGDIAYTDLNTGAQQRMDIIPTNIAVTVLSRLPVEAETLAWFCVEQIWIYRDSIVQTEPCILYLGQRPSLSPPSPPGSLVADAVDYEWCAVVASFPVYLQHSVVSTPLNRPVVNHAKASLTATKAEKQTPIIPLQGTAIMQPKSTVSAAEDAADLPQPNQDEAQYSVPLTLDIETD